MDEHLDSVSIDTRGRITAAAAAGVDRPIGPLLWTAAIASFVIGDVVTTMLGLQVGAVEANVLPAYLLAQAGSFVEMSAIKISWKLLVIGLFGAMYVRCPRPHRFGIPIGLVLLGSVAVVWNIIVIGLLIH